MMDSDGGYSPSMDDAFPRGGAASSACASSGEVRPNLNHGSALHAMSHSLPMQTPKFMWEQGNFLNAVFSPSESVVDQLFKPSSFKRPAPSFVDLSGAADDEVPIVQAFKKGAIRPVYLDSFTRASVENDDSKGRSFLSGWATLVLINCNAFSAFDGVFDERLRECVLRCLDECSSKARSTIGKRLGSMSRYATFCENSKLCSFPLSEKCLYAYMSSLQTNPLASASAGRSFLEVVRFSAAILGLPQPEFMPDNTRSGRFKAEVQPTETDTATQVSDGETEESRLAGDTDESGANASSNLDAMTLWDLVEPRRHHNFGGSNQAAHSTDCGGPAQTTSSTGERWRIQKLTSKITGFAITGDYEPAHSVEDFFATMIEEAAPKYLPLSKCVSREQELMSPRVDKRIAVLEDPKLQVKNNAPDITADLSKDLKLQNAFIRRAIACEQPKLLTYDTREKIRRAFMAHMTRDAPPGFKGPDMAAIIRADRELWMRAFDKCKSDLKVGAKGQYPLDVALLSLCTSPEVVFHLLPTPGNVQRNRSRSKTPQKPKKTQPESGAPSDTKNKPDKPNKSQKGERVMVPKNLKGYSGVKPKKMRICCNYNVPYGCSNTTHTKD
eukprot:s5096_g1.t1